MAKHLRNFLIDNNYELIEVKGDKHEQLLRWAEKLDLVSFERFGDKEFYRKEDLEIAKMWKKKYHDGIVI